jgi:hypothetical protein
MPDIEGSSSAELIVVDVFLIGAGGRTARYQKTANYIVKADFVRSYREGVTGAGTVDAYSTLIGAITETKREHGFYVSRIDLDNILGNGSRFQNVITVELTIALRTPWSIGPKRLRGRPSISPYGSTSLLVDRLRW